ncbi:MAG: type II toxin-antitoxin system RelE/ParE family toxin [Pirellulales bacterium]|nr:type II toxin-antitoxin system RelE/ParE family toxin [Pirellulales bacterium]
MIYQVRVLRRAQLDVDAILHWIAVERQAPSGAAAWLEVYERAVATLAEGAERCALAPEDEHFEFELRQFLFKTRRGRTYRGVFTIVDEEVRVLRIRGPGQAPLGPDEIGTVV